MAKEKEKEGKTNDSLPIDIIGKYDWFDNGFKLHNEETGDLVSIHITGAEKFEGKRVRFRLELVEE